MKQRSSVEIVESCSTALLCWGEQWDTVIEQLSGLTDTLVN